MVKGGYACEKGMWDVSQGKLLLGKCVDGVFYPEDVKEEVKDIDNEIKELLDISDKLDCIKKKEIDTLKEENEKYKKLYDADPDEMGCDKDRRLRNIDYYCEKLKKTYQLCKIRKEEIDTLKEENEKLKNELKEWTDLTISS